MTDRQKLIRRLTFLASPGAEAMGEKDRIDEFCRAAWAAVDALKEETSAR